MHKILWYFEKLIYHLNPAQKQDIRIINKNKNQIGEKNWWIGELADRADH